MKTADIAVQEVYDILKNGGITVPVYKYNRPTRATDTEYIVINSLPILKGVLQKCYVNVNYYAADLAPGIPDNEKLEQMVIDIVLLLEEVSRTGLMIDFEENSIGWDYQLNQHYTNVKVSVKLIN